ncbi:hypothetical protein Q767_14840 [Flavobacterium enshiense DK69]|uniref:Uncharacterized protein n=1 Tax=Flavobacterium enshiense DK69 TaxID=1107311 RepID=A0A0A2MPW0_9FLAO|nr:hypothetical protein Q767_14840 [Flavobacterium enshiense DK69]
MNRNVPTLLVLVILIKMDPGLILNQVDYRSDFLIGNTPFKNSSKNHFFYFKHFIDKTSKFN